MKPLKLAPLTLVLLVTLRFAEAIARTTLTSTDELSVNQTLVRGEFELGFFALNESWYLGIWYRNIEVKPRVWVANRDDPLDDSSGILKISDGQLVLQYKSHKGNIWSSKRNEGSSSSALVAELLINGNFVLRSLNKSDDYLWQSFNYPTDTLLPGMSLTSSHASERRLVSWKGEDNPGEGDVTFDLLGLDETRLRVSVGIKQLYLSDPWNGVEFTNVPMKFNLTRSSDEAVCVFQGTDDDHTLSMILLHPWGAVVGLVWKGSWQIVWLAPKSFCEVPNYCGKNSFCCATEPVDPDTFMSMPKATCKCILGYHPMKSGESIGVRPCERQAELSCSANEFHPFKTVKLPATASTNSFITPGLEQCKDKCLQNCECKAYSVFAYGNGSLTQNCTTWSGDLTDLGCYNSSAAQTLYIRQNGEMKTKTKTKKKKKMSIIVYVIIGLSVSALCLLCVALYCYRKRIQKKLTPAPAATDEVEMRLIREGATDDHESLPQMEFSTIVDATENFSHLIGRGGFGNVYKGLLPDGTEIAVKKLSEQSNQGNEEFYTEATSIRRLRHVNIVRLYGWSVHNDDKLLIYEYLENGSLERHLFSEPSGGGGDLDWPRRYHIVKGIAQGLAYIEEGFQDTIVHRDLKPANILLDTNMTPKISDFGFARVYGRAEDEAFTERPSGTYGYMAPEYMQGGSYSAKSDIFSFGVTVLEILSCKRNKTFAADMGLNVNLLEYAWIKLDQGDYLEVVDEKIRGDSLPDWQVLRCVQVALLCVQQQASERPNMSLVVTMLQEEDYPTPKPLRPGVIAVASTSSCQDPSGSTPTHIIEPITQVYPR